MIEILKSLLLNAKGNPITTALGMVAFACIGGGKVMTEHMIEPWGSAMTGVGAFIVIGLGLVAKDKMLPPKDPQ